VVVRDRHEVERFCVHRTPLLSALPNLESEIRVTIDTGISFDEVTLQNCKPKTFKAFIDWIYTREIPPPFVQVRSNLIELHDMARRLDCQSLADLAIDYLQDQLRKMDDTLALDEIERIFEHTDPPSKIRDFCGALMSYELSTRCHQQGSACAWDHREIVRTIKDNEEIGLKYFFFQTDEMVKDGIKPDHDPRQRVASLSQGKGYPKCYFHDHDRNYHCSSKLSP